MKKTFATLLASLITLSGCSGDGIFWTEMEFNTYFTEEELKHINAALMG